MKKSVNSKKEKQSLKKQRKLTQIKNVLIEKKLRLKSEKINKLIIFLSILVVLIAIFGIKVVKEKKVTTSMTVTQELMRALQYEQFEEGDDDIDATDNVKFSAFFLRDLDGDGYAEKIKGTCKPISEKDTLYMEIIVQTEGYLKDAKVEIQGTNLRLEASLPKDEQLKDTYISNNLKVIEFNSMTNGTQKLLSGSIASVIGTNINDYTKEDNKVILTGTYVKDDGTEIAIIKEIDLTVDWYGTTVARINAQKKEFKDLQERLNYTDQTVELEFTVKAEESKNQLILSKNVVTGMIPLVNDYEPTKVSLENTTSENLSFSYDETTREFTIERTSTVDENGDLKTALARTNEYTISVVYPIEAYYAFGYDLVYINVPVQTYYEGYNNTNSEFDNPYKSNIANANIVSEFMLAETATAKFDVKIGKSLSAPEIRTIISKYKPLKIYNGISTEETDDTYTVLWNATIANDGEAVESVMMKENNNGEEQISDNFIKSDYTFVSMEPLTSNVGIYISGADDIIKEDGSIKVYDDETDNLLITFTKDNWNTYTLSNPYKYETPVKHIRVETDTLKQFGVDTDKNVMDLHVYNIKELDDEYITTNYTREEFDNFEYIETTLNGYINGFWNEDDIEKAEYEMPYSLATIALSERKMSTQATEENDILTITASYNSNNNQVGWIDGSFLVKLPDSILSVDINSISIDNSNVDITSYEIIEENGKFIKINTKNNNQNEQAFKITLDLDITPDPRVASVNETIELYAAKEKECDYYYKGQDIYDVNNNLNTDEMINKTTVGISLYAPNSLLTNQTASEFDAKNSFVISPQVAEITPLYARVDNEKQTAKIGIFLKNNYSSTISEIVVLGKIPFEGNTTVVSEKDLGSEFTTTMTETGMEIPEELQGKIKVYYSENENPDRDINNAENGWVESENVIDWDKIKTYLISFEDEIIQKNAEYTFYYTIALPEGVNFNTTSYSHHGVYFCLDTEQGKYKTRTEPNKLGLRIVEKYNLDLIKTQTGKEKLVPGATYSITEIKTDGTIGEMRTAVTNTEGKLTINNLYVAKTYEIQEIKSPEDYELSSDVIRYVGDVDTEGNMAIIKNQGLTKEEITVVKNEGEKHKVTIQVEDEAKAKLHIIKKEQGTENRIAYVKYKITGEGLPANGKIITTNINGEITLSGLKVGEEYTLTETKAEGYYLADAIKFKIVNTDGVYTVETIEGTIAQSEVVENDSIPTVNLTLEDEKKPTYDLEISKIKRVLETELTEETGENTTEEQETVYLQGAKFKLYKGDKEIGEYITDENGKLTISGLYQYIEGKDEEAEYTLKEVIAPDGYAKVKDMTFKVQNTDGTLTLINTNGDEEKYTVEGTTVKLTIEDSPSFKLIKKDAETGEVLSNIKFAFYNVDEGTVPATNSKGEILGTKETIKGKEYYILTTDENGIIVADLPEGFYKAVEVQAPDKYDLENATYYFGVGGSREGIKKLQAEWGKGILSTGMKSIIKTSDNGYIVGGQFRISINLGNGVIITDTSSRTSYNDAILAKYDENCELQWSKTIGGNIRESISTIEETRDGGFIVGAEYNSTKTNLGNGITFSRTPFNKSGTVPTDGLIIKYSSSGEIEWSKKIGGNDANSGAKVNIKKIIETNDNGYFLVGSFYNLEIDLGNGITLTSNGSYDGMIIKYDNLGNIEWANTIGESSSDYINTIVETSDGGYILGGKFQSESINLGNEITLSGSGSDTGMIIKYDNLGNIEWAKTTGTTVNSILETSEGDYIVGGSTLVRYSSNGNVEWSKSSGTVNTIIEISDGGYIAGGSSITKYNSNGEIKWTKLAENVKSIYETTDGGIEVGEILTSTTGLGNAIITGNVSSGTMFVKYNFVEVPDIIVKRAKTVGGTHTEKINYISETSDGGYIVGGEFSSSTINLENGVTLNNHNTLSGNTSDGMIIKYDNFGNIKWANEIGGKGSEQISSIIETRDGGYIVGGKFNSSTINFGNGVALTAVNANSTYYDGMIIKYDTEGIVEWAKTVGNGSDADIKTVQETKDGGYIVGGRFYGNTIDLGNGVTLNNSYNGSLSSGMIIKYNAEGITEWAKAIIGSNDAYVYINSVLETEDGGYIVGGCFTSSRMNLGNEVNLTNTSSKTSYSDGMIIKYDTEGTVEWAKTLGGSYDDNIKSINKTSDEGYIVGGYSYSNKSYNDGKIIKYDSAGNIEWSKTIGGKYKDEISMVKEDTDEGYIAVGYFSDSTIELGDGVTLKNNSSNISYSDGMIIKYDTEGTVEWAKIAGGNNNEYINAVCETKEGDAYILGGTYSSIINLENEITLTPISNNSRYSDGMIIRITKEMGAPEAQEMIVKNERKEFNITTDIIEIDGIKGGTISGEDEKNYETVKYGDSNSQEIKTAPDENYEIIKITVNGEEHYFTPNEDDSYIMPQFTNITEDKHIEVTFALKDNKITINKVDSETKVGLEGAIFELEQIEERIVDDAVYGELIDNGQTYIEADLEKEVTDAIGTLTDNSQIYNISADTTKEVTDALGDLTNNGTYYFVEQDGKYVPTNSKTYQTANGGAAGISNSTANSYIPIDLTNYEGNYAVVVNAKVTSESADYGYATITETTTAPSYNSSTGRFIYISGSSTTVTTAKDYTSGILEGGKVYYLHLGYRKDGSVDTSTDQIEFNSIKVYPATYNEYNFIENEGKYESTNQGVASTTSNSYVPIDLTDKEGKYALIVNANVSSQANGDYGYATVTQTTTRPAYSSSSGRFIYISGTTTTVTTPKDYQATLLDGGKVYYLHLGYYKNASTNTGDDKFTVNSVKLYGTKEVTYNFIESDGKYESTNQGKDNAVSNSYIPIDLTDYEGTYKLSVNAKISSASGDYGYVTVTENTTRPSYSSSTGRIVYITGTVADKDYMYSGVLEGGKVYYLHFGYYKNASTSSGDDKFTVNSIEVIPDEDWLYHTEVTTNSEGQGITQIRFGKYSVTETVAPEGYELNENSTVIEFRADENHEFTFENTKVARVIVHHYLKDTTTKVAEDVILIDKAGYEYTTAAKLDLLRYELQKDEFGNYIIPENATGQFVSGDQEVTYYYEERPASLKVNYYIEGTETPVELNDGTIAQSTVGYGNIGDAYTTTALDNVSDKYELLGNPDNANGTYKEGTEIVTYYYRIKTYKITTRVEEREETTVTGETTTVKGGTISGEDEEHYEIVEHGDSNTKEIVIIPEDDAHKVSSVTINGVEQEFTTNEDGSATLAPIGNITEDIEIVVTFERVPTKVIVHHYIEGTEEYLPLKDGTVAYEEIYEYQYGAIYETNYILSDEMHEDYELSIIPDNHEGTVGNDTIIVTYYYKLKDYTLELTKYEENTDKTLADVEFEITDVSIMPMDLGEAQTGETEKYTTDENGKIVISNLILNRQYEIKEIKTVEGYLLNESSVIFTAQMIDGKLTLKVLDGAFKETEDQIIIENAEGDNPTVKVSMENEPIFTLTKRGDKGNYLLPGAKFAIKELVEENGTTVEKDATDYYGNLVGQEEEINGEILRVVTTDENGEINEGLKSGKYKITEVQAPENYLIGNENTYYFEIKKEQDGFNEINQIWQGELSSYKISKLADGSYIGGYSIDYTLTIPAEETANNQEISLTGLEESGDIGIIKYNSELKVENVIQLGGNGWDCVERIIATKDGGFVVVGEITGDVSIVDGNVIVSTENNYLDGAVTIKFNANCEAEWITKIDPTNSDEYVYNWDVIETSSGNFVTVGYAGSEFIINAENAVNNEAIEQGYGCYLAEITNEGNVKWVYSDTDEKYLWDYTTIYELENGNYLVSPDPYENSEYFEISSTDGSVVNIYSVPDLTSMIDFDKEIEIIDVEITRDGGMIATGVIGENQTIAGEYTVSGEPIELNSYEKDIAAFVVKVNSEFKIEWLHTLNGISAYTNIIQNENGEYVTLGIYAEDLSISENETANGESINLQTEADTTNWLITKYNGQGKVEYVNGNEILDGNLPIDYLMQISEDEYVFNNNGNIRIFKENVQEETIAEKVNLEVINIYNGPMNEVTATLEKTGPEKISQVYTNVNYEIKYNAEIQYCEGNARVTIVDTLPYPITLNKSELDGGVYDETNNTITWVEEINDIDTFTSGEVKNIEIIKNISLKYDYGEITEDFKFVENIAVATLEILEPSDENLDEFVVVKEDVQDAIEDTPVKLEVGYTINYYYDEVLDIFATETIEAEMGTEITEYIDKTEYGYEFDRVENLPLTIVADSSKNVINVYYKTKDSEIIIKYLDKDTKYEVEKEVVLTGKVFDECDLSTYEKEVIGYTMTWDPEPLEVVFTEETETYIFYYSKNTEVIVKYLEKDDTPLDDSDNLVIADEEVISGYVDMKYTTVAKDIEKYIFVESTENTEGRMTRLPIEVIYYYTRQVSGIQEKHIDVKSGEILDSSYYELPEGESYKVEAKEFEGYDIAKNKDVYTEEELAENGLNTEENYIPENFEGIVTEEPIEVKYYYIRKSTVKVQYVDKTTGELLKEKIEIDDDGDGIIDRTEEKESTVLIEGHEGDTYETVSKDFEGYVLEKVPENAIGTMEVTTDEDGNVITETVVTYYYLVNTSVIEKHIDVKTEKLLEEEIIHQGYAGDAYNIENKEFEGYDIARNKDVYTEEELAENGLNSDGDYIPENAVGTMTKEPIEVSYYYIRKASVRVQHINIKTEEVLEETIYNGYEGDFYKTTSKDFDGYELVEEQLPENAEGIMSITIDENGNITTEITVKYYYIRKAKVIVEYIDKSTGEKITEQIEVDDNGDGITDRTEEKDTTEVIEGYEGNHYETASKVLEGYELIEEEYPENATGTMEIVVKGDGTVETTIYVKYYYSKVETEEPEQPEEPEVPEIPEEPDTPVVPEEPEEPEKPQEPVKPETPTESDTPIEEEEKPEEKIATVIIRYLERGTNKVLAEELIKTGKVGEEYTTEAKTIENYTLDSEPENKNGVMTENTIVVTYYYYFTNPPIQETPSVSQETNTAVVENNTSNNVSNPETPSTGDAKALIYAGIIGLAVIANNTILVVLHKKKQKKIIK